MGTSAASRSRGWSDRDHPHRHLNTSRRNERQCGASLKSERKRFPDSLHFSLSLSRIYLSRIVEKVPKNLSSYAPDQDEGNKQQCN